MSTAPMQHTHPHFLFPLLFSPSFLMLALLPLVGLAGPGPCHLCQQSFSHIFFFFLLSLYFYFSSSHFHSVIILSSLYPSSSNPLIAALYCTSLTEGPDSVAIFLCYLTYMYFISMICVYCI